MTVVLGLWPLAPSGPCRLRRRRRSSTRSRSSPPRRSPGRRAPSGRSRRRTGWRSSSASSPSRSWPERAATRGRWADGLDARHRRDRPARAREPLLPRASSRRQVAEFLPGAFARLSLPVEYWNGLAIFVALAFPLLLRHCDRRPSRRCARPRGRRRFRRSTATLVPDLVARRIRGGARGVSASGCSRRADFAGCALVAVALAGSRGGRRVRPARDELVDDPFVAAAVGQGRAPRSCSLVCVGDRRRLGARRRFSAGRRPGRRRRGSPALVARRPARRRDRRGASASTGRDVLRVAGAPWPATTQRRRLRPRASPERQRKRPLAVLGGGSTSGRRSRSRDAAPGRTRPGGRSTASSSYFVRDAHSLYLETLGELGVVGLVLLLGALVTGSVAGVVPAAPQPGSDACSSRRCSRASPPGSSPSGSTGSGS